MESSRPIAYLVTLRTFGTWLHGDARGSHHRLHRTYGTPPLPGRPRLEAVERLQARAPARLLDARSRTCSRRTREPITSTWSLRRAARRRTWCAASNRG